MELSAMVCVALVIALACGKYLLAMISLYKSNLGGKPDSSEKK